MKSRGLKQDLARYMDPGAFRERVPDAMKGTCPAVAKVRHDKLKRRREMANKRAGAAIRFFSDPKNRARLDQIAGSDKQED